MVSVFGNCTIISVAHQTGGGMLAPDGGMGFPPLPFFGGTFFLPGGGRGRGLRAGFGFGGRHAFHWNTMSLSFPVVAKQLDLILVIHSQNERPQITIR